MFRYVVSLLLLAHGIGHIMGFLEAWTNVPVGFADRSWILSQSVMMESTIGRIFGVFWLVAMIGFVVSAYGAPNNQTWWPGLATAAALVSLAVILPWWNTVTSGARTGAIALDLITIAILMFSWREQFLQALWN